MMDYNALLYKKVQKEFNEFITKLKEMSPEAIIEMAYEKVIKEDLLCVFENREFNSSEAIALYHEKYPLDKAYQDWLKSDVTYMEILNDSVNDTIKQTLKEYRGNQKESR